MEEGKFIEAFDGYRADLIDLVNQCYPADRLDWLTNSFDVLEKDFSAYEAGEHRWSQFEESVCRPLIADFVNRWYLNVPQKLFGISPSYPCFLRKECNVRVEGIVVDGNRGVVLTTQDEPALNVKGERYRYTFGLDGDALKIALRESIEEGDYMRMGLM